MTGGRDATTPITLTTIEPSLSNEQAVGHVVGGGDKGGKGSPARKKAAAKDGMDVDSEEGAGGSGSGGPKHVLGDANLGLRRTDLDVRYVVGLCPSL